MRRTHDRLVKATRDFHQALAAHMDEGWRRSDRAANRSTGLVYKLTNKVNGKAYVGLCMVCFKKRMQGHKSKALSGKMTIGCRALNNAIRKYGWGAFHQEVLAQGVPKDELPMRERQMIVAHGTLAPRGYNLHPGGQTSPMLHPDVQAHAKEVMNSPEVSEKRQKVFSSSTFKERVGKASRESWDSCTEEERLARIQSQIMTARVTAEDKREAEAATLTPAKAKRKWKDAKKRAMEHASRKALTLRPGDTRDPVADTEAWFGPSYEGRHYRGKRRTASCLSPPSAAWTDIGGREWTIPSDPIPSDPED